MKQIHPRFFYISLAAILLHVFSLNAFAAQNTEELFEKCAALKIPAKIGRISEQNKASHSKLFILLDANYCCPENETNLLTVLEILMNMDASNQIGLIAVEGASGLLNNPATSVITDETRRAQMVKNLMSAQLFTAAEFIKAQTRPDIKVLGAEKMANYMENLLFWLQVRSPIKNRQATSNTLIEATQILASKIFPDEMLEVYSLGPIPDDTQAMYKYCTDFTRICRKNGVPNNENSELTKFTQIFTKEVRLPKEQVQKQTQKLIDRIKLSPKNDTSMPISNLERYYELGMISDLEYYTIIKNFAAQTQIETSDFEAFEQKLELLQLVASADQYKLRLELEQKKNEIQEKLLTNSNQRLLYSLQKLCKKLQRTINLDLPPGQTAFDAADEAVLNTKVFCNFFRLHKKTIPPEIYKTVTDEKRVSDLIQTSKRCVEFIRKFEKTYPHVLDNTAKQMQKQQTTAAIIITANRTTQKIATQLQKQRLSYVRISPRTNNSAQAHTTHKKITNLTLPGNSFIAPYNPHMNPPAHWADSFMQFPQQDISKSIKNTARFKSTAHVRLQSLLYAQSLRSFIFEFGPVFLAICAETEKYSKSLSGISSDISAGRINTVENSNSLIREVTLSAKERSEKIPDLTNHWLSLAFNPSMLPEKLETGCTKTASKADSQYIFVTSYLDSTTHETALNITAKSIDKLSHIWEPTANFDQTNINTGLKTVQTGAGLPIKAEDMPDFINTEKRDSLRNKLDRTGILDAVKQEFEKGIKVRGELVIIADLSTQANEVFTNLIGKVLDWQQNKNITMPELIYDVELDILNNYSTDTLTDTNVEQILFNLSAVVENASIFVENHKKLNPQAPPQIQVDPTTMMRKKTPGQTTQLKQQPTAPKPTEQNLTQATLEFESELIFSPQQQTPTDPWQIAVESLGPTPLIHSSAQIGSSLGQVAQALKKVGVIDEKALDKKSQMVSKQAKDIYESVSQVLATPPAMQSLKVHKISEEQINNILAIASRANPVAYIQAQTAGHVKIIRQTLKEIEVSTQDSILEAIKNNQTIGSKILLAILGNKAQTLDEKVEHTD